MNTRLHLTLTGPGNKSHTVSVDPLDSIGSLQNHLSTAPHAKFEFVFNSLVLSPAFTFAFYGIKDQDTLTVCRTEPRLHRHRRRVSTPTTPPLSLPTLFQIQKHTDNLYRMLGRRPDLESVQSAVEELTDPNIAQEAARLRDSLFKRIEGNPTWHRKMITRYRTISDALEQQTPQLHPLQVCRRASEPSKEALPSIFKQRRSECF